MSMRTPTQMKAIGWYCEKYNLIPQVSAHPTYFFRKRSGGGEITKSITSIMAEYKRMLKEQKNERNP